MKSSIKVLVTGSNGQLGLSIEKSKNNYTNLDFTFTDVEDLDITNLSEVKKFFQQLKPDYCINCAAYTAVDKAEDDKELNNLINQVGPKNLAITCSENDVKLIHISTDYVYDGDDLSEIFTEDSETNPKSQYAISKLNGEKAVQEIFENWMIFRTSWLYSEFGNNFVKTILKYSCEKTVINVVNDQIGSPTFAGDLANAILLILSDKKFIPGIYNYSNTGFISWYDFAKAIVFYSKRNCKINPILTYEFPAKAKRPFNSKMSKEKFISNLAIDVPNWKDSLYKCLDILLLNKK